MQTFASLRALGLVILIVFSQAIRAENPEDPWEPLNRVIFDFNETADEWVARPVAQAYVDITPTPVRRGIGNVFSNLDDVNGVFNAFLQVKVPETGRNVSRVLINSTVGLLGVFDVASAMGIERYDTDFGQTLAVW